MRFSLLTALLFVGCASVDPSNDSVIHNVKASTVACQAADRFEGTLDAVETVDGRVTRVYWSDGQAISPDGGDVRGYEEYWSLTSAGLDLPSKQGTLQLEDNDSTEFCFVYFEVL